MNESQHNLNDSTFLDLHLWSESDNLKEAIDVVYKDHLSDLGQERAIKKQLKALLMNFIERYRVSPSGYIHYSRNKSYYSERKQGMGNPLGVSQKIRDVCDRLEELTLIEQHKGTFKPIKKQTRIRPTQKFIDEYFTPYNLLECAVDYHKTFPLVRIKETPEWFDFIPAKYRENKFKLPQRKALSTKAKTLEKQLNKYNALLDRTTITLDKDVKYREKRKRIYRIFGDEKLSIHGRFYGGWWIEIKSSYRSYILINGNKTVELDYKAQHPHMLYAIVLQERLGDYSFHNDDPYNIKIGDTDSLYPRNLVKLAFMCCLNAANEKAAHEVLKYKYEEVLKNPNASQGQKTEAQELLSFVKNPKDFKAFMDDFKKAHIAVASYFYNNWWKDLMFFDSQICAYIIDTMSAKEIAVLTVHDSFIVEEKHEHTLKDVMKDAYAAIDMPLALPSIVSKSRTDI